MRSATTLLVATGTLFVAGCSLLIDAKLDGKSSASGDEGQGGSDAAASSSSSSTSTTTSAGAGSVTSTGAGQSAGASSGGCGSGCVLANALSGCIDGTCAISGCINTFEDCDKELENGCEVNLNNDVDHCGSCDKACKSGQKCAGSKCK